MEILPENIKSENSSSRFKEYLKHGPAQHLIAPTVKTSKKRYRLLSF